MDYSLYSYWRSTCSWRVRIVLSYKHLNHTVVPVNILEGKQHTQEYSTRNPMCEVPTMGYRDKLMMSQSLAIMEYLETSNPERSMVPSDPVDCAKMWEICEIINSAIHPFQNLPVLRKVEELGGNPKAWAKEFIESGLYAVEKILTEFSRNYSVEDFPTFADACILPQVHSAKLFDVEITRFPRCKQVADKMMELTEVLPTLPEQQKDRLIH